MNEEKLGKGRSFDCVSFLVDGTRLWQNKRGTVLLLGEGTEAVMDT